MLLATKNSLLYCIGRLLWRNGSTPGLMKWAKIFSQHFFAAKVLVWFFDEEISDGKIDLSPISRVSTFPALFFTFAFRPIEGAQELWSKSFKGSERDSNPGPLACQPSIITTRPWSFVAAGPAMWLFWISTCTNTSLSRSRTMRQKRGVLIKSFFAQSGASNRV